MKIAIRYYTKSKKGNTEKLAREISSALHKEALDVSHDLSERVDRLFLVNAMYAANIDGAVKSFLERNKANIGEIVNLNTSASGKSTLKTVKATADKLGIPVSDREFHCAASWIFINKGLPSADDYANARAFVQEMAQ